jgi:CRP-like cAMP-binding protein
VIASRLNLTPETFSRILNNLSSQGLIAVDGRDVTICDVALLRGYDP